MATESLVMRLAAACATASLMLAATSLAIALAVSNHFQTLLAAPPTSDPSSPSYSGLAAGRVPPSMLSLALSIASLLFTLLPRHAVPKWARPWNNVEGSRVVLLAVLSGVSLLLGARVVSGSMDVLLTSRDRPIIEQPAFGSLGMSFGISSLSLSTLAFVLAATRFNTNAPIESPTDS